MAIILIHLDHRYSIADEAMGRQPTIEHCIVVQRTGQEVYMESGRDYWYHDLMSLPVANWTASSFSPDTCSGVRPPWEIRARSISSRAFSNEDSGFSLIILSVDGFNPLCYYGYRFSCQHLRPESLSVQSMCIEVGGCPTRPCWNKLTSLLT